MLKINEFLLFSFSVSFSITPPDVGSASVEPAGRLRTGVFFVTKTAVGFTTPPVGCCPGVAGSATVSVGCTVICTGVSAGGGAIPVVDGSFSAVVGIFTIVVFRDVVVATICVVGNKVAGNTMEQAALDS